MSANPETGEVKRKMALSAPFFSSGAWIRANDLRVMSPNLGFGLFDRSISHFNSARQTSVPISPQDFGHTVVAANLANNGCFVKLADGPFGLLCCAFTYHAHSILQVGGAVAGRPHLTLSSVPPDNGLFLHRRLGRIALARAWLFERLASMALGDPHGFLYPAHHLAPPGRARPFPARLLSDRSALQRP